MSIMAKWGSKLWEVSTNKVMALEGLAFSFQQVADNNTSTEDNKTTNERGTELFPLSFTTVLHSGTGVDVRAEVESWQSLVTKVDYFYLNGKKLGPMLQLRKVAVNDVKIDNFGRMLFAVLSFEFKEYDQNKSSVKVAWSALNVSANYEDKAVKKVDNEGVHKAPVQSIKVGSRVKPIGAKYVSGQTIPQWVKDRSHEVSRINGDKALLGYPSGICNWVYLSEITLV